MQPTNAGTVMKKLSTIPSAMGSGLESVLSLMKKLLPGLYNIATPPVHTLEGNH